MSQLTRRYRGVCFDWDDTLVRTIEAKWQHHKEVARKFYDIELSDEDLARHWGVPFDDLIRYLYQDRDTLENMRAANRSLADRYPKSAHQGATTILEALFEAGIQVGIVTSTSRSHVVPELDRLNFPDGLLFIQAAEHTSYHKPDPRVFEPALTCFFEANIDRSEIVYVGDSMIDYEAAHRASIDFIGVTTGLYTSEHFRARNIRCVESLDELAGLILGKTNHT